MYRHTEVLKAIRAAREGWTSLSVESKLNLSQRLLQDVADLLSGELERRSGIPEGWRVTPTRHGAVDGFIVTSDRVDGVCTSTAVFADDTVFAERALFAILAHAKEEVAS